MSTTTLAEVARRDLADLGGRVIGPGDPDYDEARAVHNGMIDRRPALLVRCASAERRRPSDRARPRPGRCRSRCAAAATTAAVSASCDDGVVDRPLRHRRGRGGLRARTVRVGGGCTWGEVDQATHAHGLATPSGIISTTGVGGLTLGGGIGYLTRRYGLTIDNLIGAEVVLADGSEVHASADEHPELFWALRGGGGNFGVVTSFEFRTHNIGTAVMAGPTFWPIEQLPEAMRFYREFLPSAPRAVNGFFAAMTVPPADMFPVELHLRKVAAVMWCNVGSEEEATRLLAPVHDVGTPLMHHVGPVPAPGAAEPVRCALPQGSAVLLARRLLQRALRRADRPAPDVGPEAAHDALSDAHLPDRRRRARRRQHRHGLQLPRLRYAEVILEQTPTRPTPRRSETGPWTTGTRPTPTRPGALTSTS